jgi:hypothetical protein
MWAVIATVFVNRRSYEESLSAAVSRTAATLVSFAYCLVYLALLPFHVGALPRRWLAAPATPRPQLSPPR